VRLALFICAGLAVLPPSVARAAGLVASGPLTIQDTFVITCHVVNTGARPAPQVKIDVIDITTGSGTEVATVTLDLAPGASGSASFTVPDEPGDFYCRATSPKSAKSLRGTFQVNDASGPVASGEMR